MIKRNLTDIYNNVFNTDTSQLIYTSLLSPIDIYLK
jgi:hypothetical protein